MKAGFGLRYYYVDVKQCVNRLKMPNFVNAADFQSRDRGLFGSY